MASHFIEAYEFHLWRSPPPRMVQYQGESFTRVGCPIVGKVNTGKRGLQFEVLLDGDFQTLQLAQAAARLDHTLPFTGPKRLIYDGVDYFATHGHLYFVDTVEVVQCKAMARLIGPNYNFSNGARLSTRWVLTPFYIEPS